MSEEKQEAQCDYFAVAGYYVFERTSFRQLGASRLEAKAPRVKLTSGKYRMPSVTKALAKNSAGSLGEGRKKTTQTGIAYLGAPSKRDVANLVYLPYPNYGNASFPLCSAELLFA